MRNCLRCGKQFNPGKTRRLYCGDKCYRQTNDRKRPRANPENYVTAKVIKYLGSRRCTNCRYDGDGSRTAFWWDDWDRIDQVMKTAMLLCSKCWGKFNRVKSSQDARVGRWEWAAERPAPYEVPL